MSEGRGGVYGIPLGLGVISAFGLVAALLTDGPFDYLWTVAVAVPLIAIAWKLRGTRTPR
jgi:hypothetical protein